jgi:WD40 repeat protein
MEVDIGTGDEREITPQKFFNINYIAWLPDQSGWLITAMKVPDKNYRIWKIPGSGGEPTKLTADSETYSRLSLDAKGRLLVSTRIDPDFKLNLYQTEDMEAAPTVLTDGASVSFAPDKRIFYFTRMSGDAEIWSINLDGTDQRQLTHDPADDFAPIVSPDNRSVFFSSNRSGTLQVWRMATDGTNQVQVTTQEGGFPLQVSPDGQWLYYRSGLNGTLRRVSVPDGREELVYSAPPGVDIALAPDTSHIALTQRENDEYTFNILSLQDNHIEKTYRPAVPGTRPAYVIWSHDGNDLVYVLEDQSSENRTLWLQGMSDIEPRKIADLGNTDIFELSGFALSYDAKSFVVAQGVWNHNAVLIKGLRL